MTDDNDFAALLNEYDTGKQKRLQVGDRVSAKIIHLGKEDVFFALGVAQEASMPRIALGDRKVEIGDSIDAMVVSTRGGTIELGLKLGRERLDGAMLEQAKAAGIPVEGTVTGVNKGGIEVNVGGARAFCPLGQIDINFSDDPQTLVGKTMQFLVREIREGGRNVVLSRRALMEAERRAKGDELRKSLAVGQRVKGTVSRITDFGVFVDLGGVDGMIPMAGLSHARVKDAREIVKEGDTVEVDVMKIEEDPKRPGQQRIGLSMKSTQADPFDGFIESSPTGQTFPGRVVKLETFGAFIEIAPGVQGLAHISELSHKRVNQPSDVVKVGDEVQARVLSVDSSKRRIALSLKDPGASGDKVASGQTIEVTVGAAERGGIIVTLPNGAEAFLPASETGTPPGTELSRTFAPGSKLTVRVMDSAGKGRPRVSKRAHDQAEERGMVDAYNRQSGAPRSLGTLGDLLKKAGR